jgi:O-antigen/teichoic acid export membrane protein
VQAVTVAGLVILVLRYLPRGEAPAEEAPAHRAIWAYVLPLFGARIFYLSGQHLNRLILGILLSAHDLGLAAFALMTIERFIHLAGAVPTALLPSLSRLRGENQHRSIEEVVTEGYRLVAALALALSAGIFCFAREAVWITGGREFLGAILPLQILALVPLFRTMQQPLTMSFYTYERTRPVFWLAGLKFVVEPLAYPLLIPKLGVAGVAAASLLSSVIVFGPMTRLANQLFPRTADARRRATWKAWAIGIGVLALGWAIHRLGEPWPGLPARAVLYLATAGAILGTGMIGPEDLRRVARASRRPRAARILDGIAGRLDQILGRSAAS